MYFGNVAVDFGPNKFLLLKYKITTQFNHFFIIPNAFTGLI